MFLRIRIASDRLARPRWLAVGVVGLFALALSAGLTYLSGVPQPRVHDEFGYLLAGDTFARGRLTNRPHPLWQHFESFHIIQQPTYASKYPPGQGMFLALGQVLGGHPIVGVWISMGLACAAICWMLQGWLPPRWALGGGLLATLQLVAFGYAYNGGTSGYWSQSYWGGAVAALGGALTFGALPRLVGYRREVNRSGGSGQPRLRNSLLLGCGLVVMANSRPYEGLVVSLPAAGLLLGWLLSKHGPSLWVALTLVVLPIALVLAGATGMMCYYNYRVTGDPLLMPFQVYQAMYDVTPKFLGPAVHPEPYYHHAVMRELHAGWDREVYDEQRTPYGMFVMFLVKGIKLWSFYLGPLLTIPLLTLRSVARNRWMAFALATCGLSLAALFLETWVFPHYAAPMTGLVLLLVVQGMRHLRLWRWRGKAVGLAIVAALPALMVLWLIASLAVGQRADPTAWPMQRAEMLAQLSQTCERHLVIVRYGPDHSPFDEWVYNDADIDGSAVVWAREMKPEQNEELTAYFRDRRIWLLEADAEPPALRPRHSHADDTTSERINR
jgi:hypothetical protein